MDIGKQQTKEKQLQEKRMNEIMAKYSKSLYQLCLFYTADWHMAEDAFQESMIRIWKGLDSFRAESSLKTWATKVTMNTCRRFMSSRYYQQWQRNLPEEALYACAVPEADQKSDLLSAIGSLPDVYREVIILRFFEDLSLKEISELEGVSIFTVSSRIRKAKNLLKQKLEEMV